MSNKNLNIKKGNSLLEKKTFMGTNETFIPKISFQFRLDKNPLECEKINSHVYSKID